MIIKVKFVPSVRRVIPFNTGTRLHKQVKGKGAYSRREKFSQKLID
jgi:hypothetical protein